MGHPRGPGAKKWEAHSALGADCGPDGGKTPRNGLEMAAFGESYYVTQNGATRQENKANSRPAAWGSGEPRRPQWRRAEKRAQSRLDGTAPRWERLRTRSSPHGVNNSRPSPAGARPGSTAPLNQGDPPCSFPPWPPGPRQGWAAARTVSGRVNSAFLNISQHFTAHLFRPWIPNSTRCKR